MTNPSDEGAAQEYARLADANPEVVTDGVGEAPAEHEGISRVRHALRVVVAAVIMLILGASATAGYNWWQTRPNPEIRALTTEQAGLLELVAKEKSNGFNDGAIGSLVANGYDLAAQSVDKNTDTYYIVLTKCKFVPTECAERLSESTEPVVYLGIPEELPDLLDEIYFVATQVRVDFPIGDGQVKRCSVYRGKAEVGEPWPLSFSLPKTIEALKVFNGNQPFINRSPDNGASYWECTVEEVG